MRIKKIQIKNFESLVDFELEDLKPFCAFVGPNASGKSNIFEALEFTNYNYVAKFSIKAVSFFGEKIIFSFNNKSTKKGFSVDNAIYFDAQFADEIRINYIIAFPNENKLGVNAILTVGEHLPKNANSPILFFDDVRDMNKRIEFLEQWKNKDGFYENDFEPIH